MDTSAALLAYLASIGIAHVLYAVVFLIRARQQRGDRPLAAIEVAKYGFSIPLTWATAWPVTWPVALVLAVVTYRTHRSPLLPEEASR